MSQTSYSRDPIKGYAGARYDASTGTDTAHGVAAEEIPFGVLVERQVDGTIRRWRGTGKVFGVSLRHEAREGGAFAIGGNSNYKQYDQVPVARRGRVWVQFESNAVGVALAAPNFYAATDDSLSNAQYRGRATSRATSATTGAEIVAQASGVLFWKAPAAADTVAVVELSFS